MGVVNHYLTAAIQFHDTLHIFCTVKRMGTDYIKAKLLHQLIALREEVLHDIFLDMHKAYDALDCGICLEILVVYGVGTLALRLLWRYWYHLVMVSRPGGYFGPPFKGQCSVTQGDPLSPMIFNVVVDTVLQILVSVVKAKEGVVELGT